MGSWKRRWYEMVVRDVKFWMVWMVGKLDGLGSSLLGEFTGKLNCTREYLIN